MIIGGGETFNCDTTENHHIVSFFQMEEASYSLIDEEETWLPGLIPLRTDIMNGGHRCLYLGWLMAAEAGEIVPEELEPPVPPGLAKLSASLRNLIDLMNIDIYLVTAAAEASGDALPIEPSPERAAQWV